MCECKVDKMHIQIEHKHYIYTEKTESELCLKGVKVQTGRDVLMVGCLGQKHVRIIVSIQWYIRNVQCAMQ